MRRLFGKLPKQRKTAAPAAAPEPESVEGWPPPPLPEAEPPPPMMTRRLTVQPYQSDDCEDGGSGDRLARTPEVSGHRNGVCRSVLARSRLRPRQW